MRTNLIEVVQKPVILPEDGGKVMESIISSLNDSDVVVLQLFQGLTKDCSIKFTRLQLGTKGCLKGFTKKLMDQCCLIGGDTLVLFRHNIRGMFVDTE